MRGAGGPSPSGSRVGPGSRFVYHPGSAHAVLAEIIERRSGIDYRRFLHQRILEPMGLERLYLGLPAELDDRVAEVEFAESPESIRAA